MRRLLFLASLMGASSVAYADGPAINVGAQAGVILFDPLDLPATSWYVAPKVGYWFSHSFGLELDVGISAGAAKATDHNFFALNPTLSVVGNPIPAAKDSPVQLLTRFGVGAMYKTVDGEGVRGEEFANNRLEAAVIIGAGVRIPIGNIVGIRLEGNAEFTAAKETELYINPYVDYIFTAGVDFRFDLKPDKDKDGIVNKDDQCKNEAEDMDGYMDTDGCPDPVGALTFALTNPLGEPVPNAAVMINGTAYTSDADGNVVVPEIHIGEAAQVAVAQTSPTTAMAGEVEMREDGQVESMQLGWMPGTLRVSATAGDTVPEGVRVQILGEGAERRVESLDADGQGVFAVGAGTWTIIADGPNLAAVRKVVEVPPDSENLMEINLEMAEAKVKVASGNVELNEKIMFESGSDVISESSIGLVDEVANTLLAHDEVKAVEIQGHTDSAGSSSSNRKLSQRRVDAVVAALVERGVNGDMLTAIGFGEDCPLESNRSAEGREANRRVQFFVTDPEPEGGTPCHDGKPAK